MAKDEPALQIKVGKTKDGQVAMDFGRVVELVMMPPDNARTVGQALIDTADELENDEPDNGDGSG